MAPRILDSYARESAAGDRRNTSILGQHEINVRRIGELGAQLGERLDDKGKSAWKPNVVRHDWDRLITRLESGECDGAVIFDMERLLRTVEDAFRIVSAVKQVRENSGRTALIYDSDGEFDVTTPSGEKAFYDAAVAAQYYSARLSTRVRRGNRQKAARGEGRRGRYRPSGFEEDGRTVRESERAPLNRALDLAMQPGAKWEDVCDDATRRGFYSPAQDHTAECRELRDGLVGVKYKQYACDCPQLPWSPVSLRSALLAPRMAGYVKLGPKLILGRMPGEPIIEPTKWQAFNALVQSRRGRPPADRYLCTKKDSPVRCGDCGGQLTGNAASREATYEDGTLRYVYSCWKTDKVPGCGKVIADWRTLDATVSALVVDRLSTPRQLAQIERIRRERQEQRAPHETKIAALEELEAYWDQRLHEGKVSPQKHGAMVDDLHAKIEHEQAKLTRLDLAPVPPELKQESVDHIRTEWTTATMPVKRERLRQAYQGFQILVQPGSSLERDIRHRISVRPILQGR
ncbi:recombinase family protein [Streptomyces sp. NPDC046925]|uniref:recombinase family protein n=1 Tax=Streptomyces sp. NPDC046925 TaxID=3155375 RepID=UPI0033E41394